LNAGESKDVTITFTVDKDAAGEQTFTLEVRDGTKLSSKEVAVTIAKEKSFSSLSGLFANKKLLWIVGAINLVLIILIIVLAVRMLRH
jgi:uncharacterized membrane protein